jgi:hypothetical protein
MCVEMGARSGTGICAEMGARSGTGVCGCKECERGGLKEAKKYMSNRCEILLNKLMFFDKMILMLCVQDGGRIDFETFKYHGQSGTFYAQLTQICSSRPLDLVFISSIDCCTQTHHTRPHTRSHASIQSHLSSAQSFLIHILILISSAHRRSTRRDAT